MELSPEGSAPPGVDQDRGSTSPQADPESLARDARLVGAALAGDRLAAEALASRLACVPRVLGVINARRGGRLSSHDLEDLVQDTLLRIWKKLGSYHGEATLEGWLYRFCFLEFMNRARRFSRRPEMPAGHLVGVSGSVAAPDADLEREDLERSLVNLGPPDADVVRLKHYEELTFEGIAGVLGITTKMAKTRYYRGIARLQRELVGQTRERQA